MNWQAVPFSTGRSEMEYMFVGHPRGSIRIPWVDGPDWEIDPLFVAHVLKAASVNRPVLLICRPGRRSADAGVALENAGMNDIYNVAHGFEGDLDDSHHSNRIMAGDTTVCLGRRLET